MELSNRMILLERARRIMKDTELNAYDAIIRAEEELKQEYEEDKKGDGYVSY